jgi:hypothetical protein
MLTAIKYSSFIIPLDIVIYNKSQLQARVNLQQASCKESLEESEHGIN